MKIILIGALLAVVHVQLSAKGPVNTDAVFGEIAMEPEEKGLLDAFMVLSKASVVEGNLDQNIVSLCRPLPIYPEKLLAIGVVGKAVLLFKIGTDGLVTEIVVESKTENEFAEAAVTAVGQWKFAPPKAFGKPTNLLIRVTFVFSKYSEAYEAKPDQVRGPKEQIAR